ncbi:uncharacterized protein LOC131425961 [Malaya genurostris]|uniref:uncharacterized protein LOC131425961 n=1 Tax=Malaya genurostris TaxID=325434 RepID=UPI0026F3DF1D|nr:uncharacterized protein LOC131425961 [Malaya genurostris]
MSAPHRLNSSLEVKQSSVEFEMKSEEIHSSNNICIHDGRDTSALRFSDFILKQVRKFRSPIGKEYIKKKRSVCGNISELEFSARLTLETMDIKLHSEGCLMLVNNDLLASVSIEHPELLDGTGDFEQAKQVLLEQIRIEEVHFDKLLFKRKQQLTEFMNTLRNVEMKPAATRQLAVNCTLLTNTINNGDRSDYQLVCQTIVNDQMFPETLTVAATRLYDIEYSLKRRGELLACIPASPEANFSELLKVLQQIQTTASDVHRKWLIEQAPNYLTSHLENVLSERIMFIDSSDVELLADVGQIFHEPCHRKPLENLVSCFIKKVNSMTVSEVSQQKSMINPMYVLLCRSLMELGSFRIADVIKIDPTIQDWQPVYEITFNNIEGESRKREWQFILKLLKYFEPGSNRDCKSYEYEPKLLVWSKNSISENCNLLIDPSQTMGESFIWYCLLDDALASIATKSQLTDYENVLEKYVCLIRDANQDQLEIVRVVTHALTHFIACTIELSEKDDKRNSALDRTILLKQLDHIIPWISFSSSSMNHLSEMISVFIRFWEESYCKIAGFPSKIDLPQMSEIENSLFDVVLLSLDKNVEAVHLLRFLNEYNGLVSVLNYVSFDWIIRAIPKVKMQGLIELDLIELIDHEKYPGLFRVLDPLKLVSILPILHSDAEIPKHHVIHIVKAILSLFIQQLNRKQWSSGLELLELDQITSTTSLISFIRNSKNLHDQLSYDSFDDFSAANVKLITINVDESKSNSDFEYRIRYNNNFLENTWIDIEFDANTAFDKFHEFNRFGGEQLLRKAFLLYSEQYQQYMSLAEKNRVVLIAEQLKSTKLLHYRSWDAQFKQGEIPKVLAGIVAMWFSFTFKDESDVRRTPQLHSFQVLSILRLLGVDDSTTGASKHFLEVESRQGKTLVIGLSAIMLALTGHSVRVVCSNQEVAKRNRADLNRMSVMLNVRDSISYCNSENYYFNSVLSLNGSRVLLSGFAHDSIEFTAPTKRLMTGDLGNSVLLIDDVDIFRTECRYDNAFILILPGLDKIQAMIWNLTTKSIKADNIKSRIYEYIESPKFSERYIWKKFLTDSNQYNINYTNQKFFDEHLTEMIEAASEIYTNFLHVLLGGYYDIFNHLNQNKSYTSPITGDSINYGYLKIRLSELNFVAAIRDFPLVIGVFGKASTQKKEKHNLEHICGVKTWTTMPSVFGCSKLQFDKNSDFYVLDTESDWMDKIFDRASTSIEFHRPVIIVFLSISFLNNFKNKYGQHFNHINCIFEYIMDAEKQRSIDQIGVAGTVTLVSRLAVHELDYKSSSTVENAGGVHVIQTSLEASRKRIG